MTAFPETGTYDSVQHLGAAMILTKPFSLDDLRAAVVASMHQ
jgi:DNA-binding response OmpR family regulator